MFPGNQGQPSSSVAGDNIDVVENVAADPDSVLATGTYTTFFLTVVIEVTGHYIAVLRFPGQQLVSLLCFCLPKPTPQQHRVRIAIDDTTSVIRDRSVIHLESYAPHHYAKPTLPVPLLFTRTQSSPSKDTGTSKNGKWVPASRVFVWRKPGDAGG